MNPSVGQLLEAIESCPTDQVIVLPNDKNIIVAAHQASQLSPKEVAVVPTRTIPQGIAALLAFNPERGLKDNLQAMTEASQLVRTIEVTRAIRDTQIHGLQICQGDIVALIDGDLQVVAATPQQALCEALNILHGQEGLLTLYYGADITPQEAEALAEQLRKERPALQIEVVDGGQPHYYYIASLE